MPIMSRKAISEPSHSLDRERGFSGVITARKAGQVSEIDWNSLLLGKKVLSGEQEPPDAEVEAPRNSLESSPGTRTPRLSGVRHDDIPYAVEFPKPIQSHGSRSEEIFFSRTGELGKKKSVSGEVLPIKTLIAQDSSDADQEKKRRSAPSVVARLMGLDTLPDKLSKGSPTKPPKSSKSSYGSRKDTKPHSARAETCSRPPSPLHDVETIKDFPLPRSRGPTDADVCEDRTKFDILPFRSHPQERQLQEFKKEFMEKLAHQRYGPSATAATAITTATTNVAGAGAGTGDREVGAKRRLLREKLSEAKQALKGGGDESRRLSSAQEKLMESKEFQDAIELLQSNKEFFKKFFPEPNSLPLFGGNKDPPEPECPRRSFHLGDSYAEPVKHDEASRRSFHMGDFSRESRKSSFLDEPSKESSRRSFHLDELTKEHKSYLHHPHESPKESSGRRSFHLDDHSSRDSRRSQLFADDVAKEIRALEDYSESRHGNHHTGSQGHPTSEHRHHRRESRHKSPGANPVAEEVVILQKASSKVSSSDREAASWATPDHLSARHSPGRIVESRKGCDSPSRIVVLKPGPGEITLLSPAMDPSCSPQSYRVVRDSRGELFEAREVILLDPKQRFSPPRGEEPRYSREEYRDPRVDPRAIARDIVREARTNSTRELSRDRETGRESPSRHGHASLTRHNGSAGAKRVSHSKYGHGIMESMEDRISESDDTMGSFSLAALSKRHAIEEKPRCGSPTVPIPSPRSRSHEAHNASPDRYSHKDGKLRRLLEKPKAIYRVEPNEEQQHRNGPSEARVAMGPAHELSRAPMISRPRQYSPGMKSPSSKGRADSFQETLVRADGWKGADVNMYTTLPSTEKVLKVETIHTSSHQQNGGYDSQENSPRTMNFRTRSIPNAGAMAGTKIRIAEAPTRAGSTGVERMESVEHFYLKEKRAEARQAFPISKKKVAGSETSSSGRSISQQPRPVDNNAVQDLHGSKSLGSAPPVQPHNLSVVTRPPFEKAASIECGPRQGEQDFAEALSQRTPRTPPGATDTSETDESRQLSSRKQLEVPVDQKGSKSSKAWSIATETLENGDGDGASETSVDKCGQPSPVSVLDSPFEAEISSPVEFKELSSDIQDLRYRLRLLKLDGSERSAVLSESLQVKDKLITPNAVVRHTENCLESTESISSRFSSSSFPINRDLEPQALQSPALLFLPEAVDMQGLYCPKGRRDELLYVRNILVASGFSAVGKWHTPTCPLDPSLYERLEDSYGHANLQLDLGSVKSSNPCTQGSREASSRRLLFDVVNEVLLQLLGPYLSSQPWMRQSIPPLRPIPTDWELVSATWLEICSHFSPEGVEEFEALDCLMGRDVAKRSPWVNSLASYEQVGLELERIIFESLIEETVHSFAPLRLTAAS